MISRFSNGCRVRDLDMAIVKICAALVVEHIDYATLAGRILVNDLHKYTEPSIRNTVQALSAMTDRLGRPIGRIADEYKNLIARFHKDIDAKIDHSRDYKLDHFGLETMKKSYLMRGSTGMTIERPQHAYMRVAITTRCCQADKKGDRAPEKLARARLTKAFYVYDMLSLHYISHASPTMLNSGTIHRQLSSCYLLRVDDDLGVLYDVVKDTAIISKGAGGVGICLTPMRAKDSIIRSSGGKSSGIQYYTMLQDASQRYANQGGLRPGAFAVYLEVWHADIFTHIEMGRLTGTLAEQRTNAPNIKYALWVPDLFMEILVDELAGRETEGWCLFSPDEAPGLFEVYDKSRSREPGADRKFRDLYYSYKAKKLYRGMVPAGELAFAWFKTSYQTGGPYWMYKDAANRKSNLSHVRTITNSNLCGEITIPCWHDKKEPDKAETAVCNLAAINLPAFVKENTGGVYFDYPGLINASKLVTSNLDNIIDINEYPTEAGRRSNFNHRPIGVGVMGLADVFAKFKYPFGSSMALNLNEAIHACIYYGCMTQSAKLGGVRGSHPSYRGSPASKGILQPDLWVEAGDLDKGWEKRISENSPLTPAMWRGLRQQCQKAVRNGYVTASMPTATSSNVLGSNECFEPFTAMLYSRRTAAGEFIKLNSYLFWELMGKGLWDEEVCNRLMESGGSVQNISHLPLEIRSRFRTAREIDASRITYNAARMGPFISQSSSVNYYYTEPKFSKVLTEMVRSWKLGSITGSYYIFSAPATGSQKNLTKQYANKPNEQKDMPGSVAVCSEDVCETCSV